MNLFLNSKTLLFSPFSASSKAASLSTLGPTYSTMSCESVFKSAKNQNFKIKDIGS